MLNYLTVQSSVGGTDPRREKNNEAIYNTAIKTSNPNPKFTVLRSSGELWSMG